MKNILATVYALTMTVAGCGVQYIDVPVNIDTRHYYRPDPELQAATQESLDRLKAATGAEFQQTYFGTPVKAVDPSTLKQCETKDGKEACWNSCAWTLVTHKDGKVLGVEIRVGFPQPPGCMSDVSRTIEHELVHSVRRYLDIGHEDQGHTKTGVFQPVANDLDNHLDEASLLAVCEGIDCNEFNPEE